MNYKNLLSKAKRDGVLYIGGYSQSVKRDVIDYFFENTDRGFCSPSFFVYDTERPYTHTDRKTGEMVHVREIPEGYAVLGDARHFLMADIYKVHHKYKKVTNVHN